MIIKSGSRLVQAQSLGLALIVGGGMALDSVAHAGTQFRLSSGATYTTGDYGTDTTMDVWHVPITARLASGPIAAQVTVPYMEITRKTADVSHTASGMGDIETSLRLRVLREGDWRPEVALTGKARFATADEELGLADENIYYGEINLGKRVAHRVYLFGTLGYQTRKDTHPENGDRESDERHYGTAGLDYTFTARTSGGVMVTARESWGMQSVDQSTGVMAIPYLTNSLGDGWRLQSYGIAGLSESSPDWGAGFSLGYNF
ncbi:hypothetical protein ACNSTU_12515 [Aquisalimonas sp. APHAB1-3]|uniref:hypothetical protein n=1 Tax=Aquisalimonas sp. APHAB1-3 TaxID=3402080 RepID=UPI003AAF4763